MDISLTAVNNIQNSPAGNQNAGRVSGSGEDLNFAELYGRTAGVQKKEGSGQSLTDIFKAAGKKYGVDYKLLMAVGKEESNFKADAVSGAGAVGIMQLMPSTARSLGVDPYDPEENIYGAAKLISKYLKQYDGDVSLALAAYGAGPGAVDKYGGVPPYKETTGAIKKILHYYENGVDAPYKAESSGSAASVSSINSGRAKKSNGPVNGDIINPYYGMSAKEALHEMLLDKQLNGIESTDLYLTSNTDEDLSASALSSGAVPSASSEEGTGTGITSGGNSDKASSGSADRLLNAIGSGGTSSAAGILSSAGNILNSSDSSVSSASSTPGYSDFADAYLNMLGSTGTGSTGSGTNSYDPSNISLNSNIFNV